MQDSLGCLGLHYSLICEVKLWCIWVSLIFPPPYLLWRGRWMWNRIAADAWHDPRCDQVYLKVSMSIKGARFCSTGGRRRPEQDKQTKEPDQRVPLLLSSGWDLAAGWRESCSGDPGHRPAPRWALPGHGVNTEWAVGTHSTSVTTITYLNKTVRHAKLRSMHWVQHEKTIVAQFFSAAEQLLWDSVWTMGTNRNK